VLPPLQEYETNKDKRGNDSQSWHAMLSVSSLDEVGMCWWDAGDLHGAHSVNK
jgi:hypothetical protein